MPTQGVPLDVGTLATDDGGVAVADDLLRQRVARVGELHLAGAGDQGAFLEARVVADGVDLAGRAGGGGEQGHVISILSKVKRTIIKDDGYIL